MQERLKLYLRRTGGRTGTRLGGFLPIVGWLPRYKWGDWLRADLIAGISVSRAADS